MPRMTVGIFAATLASMLAITAAESGPKILVQPFVGMRTVSSFAEGYYENEVLEDLDVAPGAEFGVVLDVPVWASGVGQMGAIELTYSYQKSDLRFEPTSMNNVPPEYLDRFEVDGDKLLLGDVNVSYLHIGGLYQFGDYSGWLPLVNIGLGATIFSAPDGEADTETKFSASFGGGVTRMFTESIGTRLQLRGNLTSLPANEAYWVDPWGGVWAVADDNSMFQGDVALGVIFAF